MTIRIVPMPDTEVGAPDTDGGLGCLRTDRGNLPLESVDAAVTITGLVAGTMLTQGYRNPYDVALEATYVFPLPDRAAVTAMRMTADGRVVEAELKERATAREEYDRAIAEGRRASIAEEERPDVFTMRVGNILPGERVSVALTIVGPLSYEDGEATYRLPLVVAPRYIPGAPLEGASVGLGTADDTDAVPDASRITPPVLLPGFPNPVRLGLEVDIDPAGLPLGEVRSSLHTIAREGNHLSVEPGERCDRDFILRLAYGEDDRTTHSLTLTPDAEGDEGTFRLTLLPPTATTVARPRDVVLVLDRSGSMQGWKMVAARRAAGRIVDTLTTADRFAAFTFDTVVEHPSSLPEGLVAATDRHRFRAVEHLARVDARGGTELLAPLVRALDTLSADSAAGERDRVLVLVTDGQVGNEDQILASVAPRLAGVRVHTVGIDQAVNAGFLGRLAAAGGGRCELVESEDRLDAAMDRIHRRIGSPVVTNLTIVHEGLTPVDSSVSPARLPDLFPGAPLVVTGRFSSYERGGALSVGGRTRAGADWSAHVAGVVAEDRALTAVWARAHLRDLEDAYVTRSGDDLERRIVATSLRFGVLCRFTAWLAVDTRVVTDGGAVHRVIQPVESPAGWEMPVAAAPMMARLSAARPLGFAGQRPSAAPVAPAAGWRPGPKAQAGGTPIFAGGRNGPRPIERPQPSDVDGPAGEAEEALSQAQAPELVAARSQAAEEARRLRAAQHAPDLERRELLADLGSRLDALVRHLTGRGVTTKDLAPVRELVSELGADRPLSVPSAVFEALWARALLVLDTLAGGAGPGPGRRAFWKLP